MPHTFSAEELASLTEAEREGLEDETLVDDPIEDVGADDATPSPAADATKEAEPEKPAPASEPVPETEPPPPAPPAAEGTAEAQRPRPAAPAVHAAPPDIDKQIADTKQAQRELAAKFDSGDLTAIEYEQQRQELDDQLFERRMLKSRAAQSFDDLRHHFLNVAVPDFLDSHAEYAPGTPLYDALDEKVRVLQVTSYAANPFDPEVITKAHEALSAIRGVPSDAPKPPPPPPPPQRQRQIPPTLGSLPAAGEDDLSGDGGRFAHLDRLTGLDYETALAALSPADRDRYLQQ